MACAVTAMYIDSLAYDDSFAVYEFNERSDEDGFFHGSRRSLHFLDTVETDHSESTVANFSCSSFNSQIDDECEFEDEYDDEFTASVPAEEIKSPTKASSRKKTTIRFAGVNVREYTVVVGCQNISCPLELDWEYVEFSFQREEDYRAHSGPRGKIQPLSYQERKEIIAVSQDVSISHVKYLEQEMLNLHDKNLEGSRIFSPEGKCGVKQLDSPPRRPSNDNKTIPPTMTSTSNNATITNDAMTTGNESNRNDSPPRRPSNSYD
jgi:hypothetical protein